MGRQPFWPSFSPAILQIIQEINVRFLREVANCFPGDVEKIRHMSIFEEGHDPHIRMAYLAIVGSHSVNGVSALHTELLKSNVVPDFYQLYPDRFNNEDQTASRRRRWLRKCNTGLADLITSTHWGRLDNGSVPVEKNW